MSRTASLSIEHALLGFLLGQRKHGYAMYQELEDPMGLGPVWQIKLSQLYALLGKLEDTGYIVATLEPQESKPPRKVYQLTAEGEEAFAAWVQSPVKHGRSLRLEFLVKLYFARQQSLRSAAQLLSAQRELCRDWAEAETQIIHQEKVGGRRYSRLVHTFRLGQIEAMIAWLDQCEAELED
jgi:PadR family transcriptional regulator AphA